MVKQNKILNYELFCTCCKKEIDERKVHTKCPVCGCAINLTYDYDLILKRLNKYDLKSAPISSQKYLDFLPISDFRKVITLQEGGTPLYKIDKLAKKYKLKNLYLKNEGANPTGVFKDRGSFVEITKAIEAGAKVLIIASSGNMAASAAAYASKAGLRIIVLVPEETPIGKLSQIISYGALVIKIRGDYTKCVEIVDKLAENHGYYQVGDYVFRREGQKTLAFEIIDQLGFKAPDYVVVPTGAGTHIAGLWKGFTEYKKLKLIDSLPKMIAVQPEGCPVLLNAFQKRSRTYKALKEVKTLCTAVAVRDPMDGDLALKAVYESEGAVLGLSDKEALDAQKLLSGSEGIFSEPSSSLSIGVIPVMVKKKIISRDDTVVCIATGNGLKDPMAPLQNIKSPRTFEADYRVIGRYLKTFKKL